jgi:hypothetical protein
MQEIPAQIKMSSRMSGLNCFLLFGFFAVQPLGVRGADHRCFIPGQELLSPCLFGFLGPTRNAKQVGISRLEDRFEAGGALHTIASSGRATLFASRFVLRGVNWQLIQKKMKLSRLFRNYILLESIKLVDLLRIDSHNDHRNPPQPPHPPA